MSGSAWMNDDADVGGGGSVTERSRQRSRERSKEDVKVSATGGAETGAETGAEGDTIIGKREAGGANKVA